MRSDVVRPLTEAGVKVIRFKITDKGKTVYAYVQADDFPTLFERLEPLPLGARVTHLGGLYYVVSYPRANVPG